MRALSLAAVLSLALVLPASAHRVWMLPSSTVLSGGDAWVTFDAAVSNDLFVFEHVPMRLEGLAVTGPEGTALAHENAATGKFRSTFDIHLTKPGSYRAAIVNDGVTASYKLDGAQKRWRGKAEALKQALPAGAQDVKVTRVVQRTETFVTLGKPDATAFAPAGKGLELRFDTHPNNLTAGETARFTVLLDGAPAPGIAVEVVRGGSRYRDKSEEQKLTSGPDGVVSVTWAQAGQYWFGAEAQDDKSGIEGARRRSVYAATFEVLPQ
ncbi:ABC transporter permease [Methylobacterium sp. Leaf399]|uniref:DUF4198 domain-containing protein n=1 Tax=unclassified Methylobacterium TaxID=2615210 RepID=UPI0006F42845|nr:MULTISPECIES: DUF4198 domain-containing protein [unclassified Methylobacterium]KQP51479.1 ABC transporter permease [Methylobacterium sp. Leaf108]KQT17755.1 ABC transporter permease [Methylobacterium sp. Leaf399]